MVEALQRSFTGRAALAPDSSVDGHFELEPLDAEQLAPAARTAHESVLAFDGQGAAALVESAPLALHDGPFRIERRLRDDEFRERRGGITETQASEFGHFARRAQWILPCGLEPRG